VGEAAAASSPIRVTASVASAADDVSSKTSKTDAICSTRSSISADISVELRRFSAAAAAAARARCASGDEPT